MTLRRLLIIGWILITPGLMARGFAFSGPTVAVFDTPASHEHSGKVLSVFTSEWKGKCSGCKAKLFPIYDSKGDLKEAVFLKALGAAEKEGIKIFHLSWNMKSSPATTKVEEKLKMLFDKGIVVIGAAGENPENQSVPLKLAETVLGHVPSAFIIGEANEKGFLAPRSNYGEEMFTAYTSPKGFNGSSFSSAVFTAEFAVVVQQTNDVASFAARLRKAKQARTPGSSRFPNIRDLQ